MSISFKELNKNVLEMRADLVRAKLIIVSLMKRVEELEAKQLPSVSEPQPVVNPDVAQS